MKKSPVYQLFILFVSLLALILIAATTFLSLDPGIVQILDIVDFSICVIFILDFLKGYSEAENKRSFFLKWGWIDLLSAIPSIEILRFGRTIRIMKIFRILRSFKSAKVIFEYANIRKGESVFLAVSFISFVIIIIGSIAIYEIESGLENSNIKTASDAIWWAFVTMTTVGYGDHFPVSDIGRIIASVLLICGVGLFGTFTGFVGSWFISDREIGTANLHEEIDRLKDLLENSQEIQDKEP